MKTETQKEKSGGSGSQISPLTVVAGGKQFVAAFLDGRAEELVLIRQLPVKTYDAYLAALQDERLQVALFCDRPLEWVDALAPESFHTVMTVGEELNLDFFVGWHRRRIERMDRMNPGARQAMQKQIDSMAEAMTAAALKGSSPTLPLAAALDSTTRLP